jgi:hypothetical protein
MPDFTYSPFTIEEVHKFAETIHAKGISATEKQDAVKNLSIHFELKFKNEQKILNLFKKLRHLENDKIDERSVEFLGFISDYNSAFSNAVDVMIKYIVGESYTNDNPEGLFVTILNNKIVDIFRRYQSTISNAQRERIKEAAKKQPTIHDFYKNYDSFKRVIDIRQNKQPNQYRLSLLNSATPEQMSAIQNALDQFKDTFNIETIWAAIEQENYRCFNDNRCMHCNDLETCLKHLIMILNKRDGMPYEDIKPKTPFKSLRQIISRRYNRIKQNLLDLQKNSHS